MSNGFWINFNPSANEVLSNLSNVNQQIDQLSQVMSTGNQVNTAADNPAAYAISQTMQMTANGLNVAVQNAQEGIAMLQTATGAQQQILSILQTMNQLATQAAQSGTQQVTDRAGLQLEMNSLAEQINSITNQTQYNGLNILSGQFGSSGSNITLQVGSEAGQTISFNIDPTDVVSLGIAGEQANGTATNFTTTSVTGITVAAVTASDITAPSDTILQSGDTYRIIVNGNYNASGTFSGGTVQLQVEDGNGQWDNIGSAVQISSSTTQVDIGDPSTGAYLELSTSGITGATGPANGASTEIDQFQFNGISSSTGTSTNGWQSSTNVVGPNILTQSDASNAITAIQNAIHTLTAQEEQLGAVQNRLNYTISDLQNSSSNLQSANSVIVGANMAQAETQFTQEQTLEEAGISVLSQVNQQPALLLKLFG